LARLYRYLRMVPRHLDPQLCPSRTYHPRLAWFVVAPDPRRLGERIGRVTCNMAAPWLRRMKNQAAGGVFVNTAVACALRDCAQSRSGCPMCGRPSSHQRRTVRLPR
jgi:hypothetical protein